MFGQAPPVDDLEDHSDGEVITPPDAPASDGDESQDPQPLLLLEQALEDKIIFLEFFGLSILPHVPATARPIQTLLTDGDAWTFSADERARLSQWLESTVSRSIDENTIALFEALTKKHEEARVRLNEARDNVGSAPL